MTEQTPSGLPAADTPAVQAPILEVTIAAPRDTVWDALRTREVLHQWHGWHGDDLADEIDLIYFREAVETDPGRSLVLGGGDHLELLVDDASTRVRLTRAPLSGDAAPPARNPASGCAATPSDPARGGEL